LNRDVARAIAFFGRACYLDDSDASFIDGGLLAAGEGIVPDNERAVAFFLQACEEGMELSCSRAASLAPRRESEFRHCGPAYLARSASADKGIFERQRVAYPTQGMCIGDLNQSLVISENMMVFVR